MPQPVRDNRRIITLDEYLWSLLLIAISFPLGIFLIVTGISYLTQNPLDVSSGVLVVGLGVGALIACGAVIVFLLRSRY